VGGASSGGGPDNGNGTDTGGSAEPVDSEPPCEPSGPFGAPELVVGLGITAPSFGPAPSNDGLTLFFSSVDLGEDIFFATRTSRDNDFSSAQLVSGINGPDTEDGTPYASADGRSLYFFSTRPDDDALGDRDLWVANRSSAGELTAPRVVPGVNHAGLDHLPRLTADELTLMFVSGRDSLNLASNIWVAQRPSPTAEFSEPVELAGVNTDAREEGFWLSADELSLFFASNRQSTQADMDIWVATRESATSAFGEAERVGVLNTPDIEIDPALTPDGFELFFASDRSGTMRLYRSARQCP
jgi:Tol biopolymer transport system component